MKKLLLPITLLTVLSSSLYADYNRIEGSITKAITQAEEALRTTRAGNGDFMQLASQLQGLVNDLSVAKDDLVALKDDAEGIEEDAKSLNDAMKEFSKTVGRVSTSVTNLVGEPTPPTP